MSRSHRLDLHGLTAAAGQRWGSVRVVPLLRATPRYDLRLALHRYGPQGEGTLARVDRLGDSAEYCTYVPHGLVVGWGEAGEPSASWGARLAKAGEGEVDPRQRSGAVARLHGMARRRGDHALRMLPLHLALEGFLALCFRAPEVLWEEYSDFSRRFGLGFTSEGGVEGSAFADLGEALRVFEVHEGQCGVLLFVGDDLATAFLTPNPEDYRALHASLLEDVYGPALLWSELHHPNPPEHASSLGACKPVSLRDVREALARDRAAWAGYTTAMAAGLLERPLQWQGVYRAGDFSLERFLCELRPSEDNHVGEAIFDKRGQALYLKTFRLSDQAVKRAYLLQRLSQHQWKLEETAKSFGQSKEEFVLRLERAGFGYLLRKDVLDRARAALRGH